MIINLSPTRCDDALTVTKAGDVLTINGDPVDLSAIPDGATLPAGAISNDHIAGPVERINGVLHVTLRLPHGPVPEAWQAFPDPIVAPADGLLDLPCNTVISVTTEAVEGGVNIVTTTRHWRQAEEVSVEFIANPEPAPEETADGDD